MCRLRLRLRRRARPIRPGKASSSLATMLRHRAIPALAKVKTTMAADAERHALVLRYTRADRRTLA
jgi:hypothetical protein